MKAALSNYRQSPRKVRLVASLVQGKTVGQALEQLQFLPRRAALPLAKLIKSAAANAGAGASELVIGEFRVDKGPTLRRSRPRARGSAFRINKRTSHVLLTLKSKTQAGAKSAVKKAETKTKRVKVVKKQK